MKACEHVWRYPKEAIPTDDERVCCLCGARGHVVITEPIDHLAEAAAKIGTEGYGSAWQLTETLREVIAYLKEERK